MVALHRGRVLTGWCWVVVAVCAAGRVALAQEASPPPLQGPVANDEAPKALAPADEPAREAAPAPADEPADRSAPPAGQRERIAKAPPPPTPEEPSEDRVDPRSVWVPGHWAWSAKKNDYVWTAGSWRVPPEGATWVAGRWMRDDQGWYWVPGYWNKGKTGAAPAEATKTRNWRVEGPPPAPPDEPAGPAPSATAFYIPGYYTPDGDRLVWIRGFWAEGQPGWDWIPAHWVQRSSGWEFRKGYWLRDAVATPVRRTVARPVPDDRAPLPPAIVESQPSGTSSPDLPSPTLPDVEDSDTKPRDTTAAPRDPIAEAEAGASPVVQPRVYVAPGYPYSYYPGGVMIRPPGMYPYGAGGMIVRGLLNRMLPY